MGQIKNIKLHIVTDIKKTVFCHAFYSISSPSTNMSAFRPRSLLKVARNVNQAVRSYSSQSSGGSAYRLPALFGSAVLAGSAVVAMKSEYGVQGFLPSVHASPPKPIGAPMERTFEQRGYKLVAMKMLQA